MEHHRPNQNSDRPFGTSPKNAKRKRYGAALRATCACLAEPSTIRSSLTRVGLDLRSRARSLPLRISRLISGSSSCLEVRSGRRVSGL